MEWKFVPDTNELYSISEAGVIRSNKNGRVLGGTLTSDGYRQVGFLMNTGKRKSFLYHRIVAMTWHPNPEGLAHVDHIDCNRDNNHPSNLQWMSARENVDKAHFTVRETITLISPTGEEVDVECAYNLAKCEGLCMDGVRALMKGTRVKHKGWTRKE